jgi:hypothetical protein
MSETGSVKFRCEQLPISIPPFSRFDELNRARSKLIKLDLVGVDANGIGFGNLSVRDDESSRFYITGSGTGSLTELSSSDYARVVAYDFARGWIRCEGTRIASSESLTHAAVYESDSSIGAVIHCHHFGLWKKLLNKVPTTLSDAEYGTPEMAFAVKGLFNTSDVKTTKMFVMAAHPGGLVSFGMEPGAALEVILRKLENGGD